MSWAIRPSCAARTSCTRSSRTTNSACISKRSGPRRCPSRFTRWNDHCRSGLDRTATIPTSRTRVRAYVTGGSDKTRIWAPPHHTLLASSRNGDWVEADVPRGILRSGANVLGVWCDQRALESTNPVILHRVFVPVSLRPARLAEGSGEDGIASCERSGWAEDTRGLIRPKIDLRRSLRHC